MEEKKTDEPLPKKGKVDQVYGWNVPLHDISTIGISSQKNFIKHFTKRS
ncbi:hypothetical protein SynA1562_01063 [Synechococcus sp. A15-62]|nr:hypothetical protein SynA1562_01063 [Synechococcus sp. A15-62]